MATTPADSSLLRHQPLVLLIAVVLPVLACLLIAPFRASVENTNAALVLVLLVVAAASTGLRSAGILAALSSTLSFDFFLTAPFHRLSITDRSDVETSVLLILVGTAVTEVALWGRRQQGRASNQEGYLDGILQTVSSASTGGVQAGALADVVADQLQQVLDLDACVFRRSQHPRSLVRLRQDGQVTRNEKPLDIDAHGLPTDTEIELLVQSGGTVHGRYLLTAATSVRRPTLQQRRVAVALADQVGVALAHPADHEQRADRGTRE